jgi:hypothetical protein
MFLLVNRISFSLIKLIELYQITWFKFFSIKNKISKYYIFLKKKIIPLKSCSTLF